MYTPSLSLISLSDLGCSMFSLHRCSDETCNIFIKHFQAVNPLNNIINDPNSYSILGRIVRITDDVILYRQWIQKTFPVNRPITSSSTHHVTPTHPAAPPTPPVQFHTQNNLKVSTTLHRYIKHHSCKYCTLEL